MSPTCMTVKHTLHVDCNHLSMKCCNNTLFCFSVGCDWPAVLLQHKIEGKQCHTSQGNAACKACIFIFS